MKILFFVVLLFIQKSVFTQFDYTNLSFSSDGLFACSTINITPITRSDKLFKCEIFNVKEKKIIITFDSVIVKGTFSDDSKYLIFLDSHKNLIRYDLKKNVLKQIYNLNKIPNSHKRFGSVFFIENNNDLLFYLFGDSDKAGMGYMILKNINEPSKIETFYIDEESRREMCYNPTSFNLYKQKKYTFTIADDYKSAIIKESTNNTDSIKRLLEIKNFFPKVNVPDSIFWSCGGLLIPSSDGNVLFLCRTDDNNTGYLIDANSFKIISKIKDTHPFIITNSDLYFNPQVLFATNNKNIVTVNTKNEICLWQVKTGKLIAKFNKSKFILKGNVPDLYFLINNPNLIVCHSTNFRKTKYRILNSTNLKQVSNFELK